MIKYLIQSVVLKTLNTKLNKSTHEFLMQNIPIRNVTLTHMMTRNIPPMIVKATTEITKIIITTWFLIWQGAAIQITVMTTPLKTYFTYKQVSKDTKLNPI